VPHPRPYELHVRAGRDEQRREVVPHVPERKPFGRLSPCSRMGQPRRFGG
jgi:hypothetical protein